MRTTLKKLIISLNLALLVFVPFFTSFASSVKATDDVWYDSGFFNWYTMVYNDDNPSELFGERYTAAQVQWVYWSTAAFFLNWFGDRTVNTCFISAFAGEADISSCATAAAGVMCKYYNNLFTSVACSVITDTSSPNQSSLATTTDMTLENNLAGRVTNAVGTSETLSIMSRPMSSTEYFRDLASKLHIIPEAEAQEGFGYDALNPVLKLWQVVRNLTYVLLIFVIVIMAFMIMFRVKLSPQVAISVQSALPKVIITLILITFSYAIAGLMIDLMYLVMGLLAGVLVTSGISGFDWQTLFGAMTYERSVFSLMWYYSLTFYIGIFFALGQSGILGILTAVSIVLPILLIIIAAIVLTIAMVRIIWLMLKTYVMIMILVMFGPIQILFGAFGGGGFTKWLKDLAAHLAVYPSVSFLFVLSFIFLRGAYPGTFGGQVIDQLFPFNITNQFQAEQGWTPPLTMGAGNNELLWLGASFVIIMMIPKVNEAIKGFMSGRGFSAGMAFNEGMAPVTNKAQEIRGRYGAATGQERTTAFMNNEGMLGRVGSAYTNRIESSRVGRFMPSRGRIASGIFGGKLPDKS